MTTRSELNQEQGTVYIVDDEAQVRRSLTRIVERAGWTPRPCDSGDTLFQAIDGAHPACIVLDLAMPQASGVEVYRELLRKRIDLPVIFLTGSGSVPVATGVLREGAFDFLEKPVDVAKLVKRLAAAMVEDTRRVELAAVRARFEHLSRRELEICALLARGRSSKEIGRQLSISSRTVEHHRERLLQKTGAANMAELSALHALVHPALGEGSGSAPS